tara:strand:- start:3031 stop:3396 length:366 start_codon:yes stop_codon:yes gene_type:complete
MIDYEAVHVKAHVAGLEAGRNVDAEKYHAVDEATGKVYEPFELCGFATVQVKGANKGFGKWLANNEGRTDRYYGGAALHVFHFNQSWERKGAYARAYAKTATALLAEQGEEVEIWTTNNMD